MIDLSLLGAVLVAALGAGVFVYVAAPITLPATAMVDRLIAAGVAAVVVGRLVAVAFDDPGAFNRPADLLLIRSGVEFWPGVTAGVILLAAQARRERAMLLPRLADLAPYVLVGYGLFEVSCLLRDACFGPESPVGLSPGDLRSPQFPIGVIVGVLVVATGLVLRFAWRLSAPATVMAALGVVAGCRFLASFWLPAIGSRMPRPQLESLGVLLGVAVVGAVWTAPRWLRQRRWPGPSVHEAPSPRQDRR